MNEWIFSTLLTFSQIAEDQSRRQFLLDQIKEDIRSAEELKAQKNQEEKVLIEKYDYAWLYFNSVEEYWIAYSWLWTYLLHIAFDMLI